eukprot:TRINITY_DN11127_c0_g1_i2.p1 TRINITY_DN11127_c0_g1~~TRINITY_DN11127_c0_g1_i2.p1  ORF type:complete len:378 (+),score=113.81 TRINITY_DN11127_c0_g1_i2:87-1136(+)
MGRSQVLRLRAQLAACREQLSAKEHEVANLNAAMAITAAEHAATERCLRERLAAADARYQEAEQRAQAAELWMVQYNEAEQHTELAAAEEAARAELAALQAHSRKAVQRQKECRRKNRQKWRKGQRGHRKHEQPASPLECGSCASTTDELATARSVMSTSSGSSTRTPSKEALFIDNICFWVAAFVPYSWAPVCSDAARMVLQVVNIDVQVWVDVYLSVSTFQSMGSHYAPDLQLLGPDLGWLYHAYLSVQALRHEVFQLMKSDSRAAPAPWASRFLLHMDFQSNMYETMRLGHKDAYLALRTILAVKNIVRRHISQALEAFDQRKLAEEGVEVGNVAQGEVDNSDSTA